ncbi:hypothetical protein ACLF3G_03165 [Falsiroseomonas sp. HC035]|uniref:hypothetical protein n=1 Tax=Falsiroseomonas sp. HC035 TaxID=3390999 RepID=UPI003D322310
MMSKEDHAARAARPALNLADLEPLLLALCASATVLGMTAMSAADEEVSVGQHKGIEWLTGHVDARAEDVRAFTASAPPRWLTWNDEVECMAVLERFAPEARE